MPIASARAEILEAHLAWACLNILTKRRCDFLCEEFGDLEKAWRRLDAELLRKMGCREETARKVMCEREELDLEKQRTLLATNDIRLLSFEDAAFPAALREIGDPPVFLFAKGNLEILRQPSLALVGTREMSPYGKRVTEFLVTDLVRAGVVTVSGLAAGIDAEVARVTLSAGGQHVGVLGHGLSAIYPRSNTLLAGEILAHGGLLLTEFPLHITPDKYTFPARNRIIAGLTLGTVVIEAASQSGSLITASLALEYGREVFAVPGQIFDPHFDGTHELIAKGSAKLIRNAAEILRELGVVVPERNSPSRYRAQTPDEQTLLGFLTTMPQHIDDLIEQSGLPIGTVNATLTLMELKGGAKNVGMGNWVKA